MELLPIVVVGVLEVEACSFPFSFLLTSNSSINSVRSKHHVNMEKR
jgi:hypothetical protein